MEIYRMSEDELSEYDLDYLSHKDYKWIVYSYHCGGYDGNGVLIAKISDRRYDYYSLGHCSCYGPVENTPVYSGMNKTDVRKLLKYDDGIEGRLRTARDYDYHFWKAIKDKVLELLR